MSSKALIFQGMCYSGKSTLGKMVADTLGLPFLDSRDLFFMVHGISEIEYLNMHGRDKFIEAEKQSLYHDFKGVVSLGGSAVYYPKEMSMLKQNHTIIWLNVSLDIIEKRKALESRERPIVYPNGINSFEELYNQRAVLYPGYCNYMIEGIDNESIQYTVQRIVKMLEK